MEAKGCWYQHKIRVKTNWIIKKKKNIEIKKIHAIHTGMLCDSYFRPFPSSSFKMRFRKSDTIRGSPSLREIFGSQFSSCFALLISGFLIWGSSAVFALNSIVALESIVSFTTYERKSKAMLSILIRANIQRESPCEESKSTSVPLWIIQRKLTNLCKLQHCEFPRVTQVKRPHVLTFHKCHQSVHLTMRKGFESSFILLEHFKTRS